MANLIFQKSINISQIEKYHTFAMQICEVTSKNVNI